MTFLLFLFAVVCFAIARDVSRRRSITVTTPPTVVHHHTYYIAVKYVPSILLVMLATSAMAQNQRSFYDRNGSFAGQTFQHGNGTSAYDRNGSFAGSSTRNSDGSTTYYDKDGHFAGSSPRPLGPDNMPVRR